MSFFLFVSDIKNVKIDDFDVVGYARKSSTIIPHCESKKVIKNKNIVNC